MMSPKILILCAKYDNQVKIFVLNFNFNKTGTKELKDLLLNV